MIEEYAILAQYELEKRKAEEFGQDIFETFYSVRQIRDKLERDLEDAHENLRSRGVLKEKGGDRHSPETY
jgi:hypothetical protein